MRKYSIVIPVYNRPNEVEELLDSLLEQTYEYFEVIIVEDGSSESCEAVVKSYQQQLDIQYFYKKNTGPGDSRNFGMAKASGDFIVLFDSDCLIPPQYFQEVEKGLRLRQLDAYGGPDAAHPSFSVTQKAINYAMTSFFTTGGIRGKEKNLDHFTPRSFNMGVSRAVWEKVGGFSDVHPGEDPDWSYRIMDAGFRTGLIPAAFVYHKRRIDFQKFRQQVYKFGLVRNVLLAWHPSKFKPVFLLPSIFLVGSACLVLLAAVSSLWYLFPLGLLAGLLFADALVQTASPEIALQAVPASFIQLYGYGWGFLQGYIKIHLMGVPPREAFPKLFFKSVHETKSV